jgi:hypothetical protein
MRRPWVIHPLLFGVFPVLFLFSYNKESMSLGEIVMPALVIMLSVCLILLLLWVRLRDRLKAGILVSGFVFLVFSYGHFYRALTVVRHACLIPVWVALFALLVYGAVKTRRDLTGITAVLNMVAISLVVISVVDIGIYAIRTDAGGSGDETESDWITETRAPEIPAVPRDIYYVILDRYAADGILEEFYGFDNSEFISYLEGQGFYVARESRANYLKTAHSLASSLNMEYINYLAENQGRDSDDWTPLYRLLQDYRLWRFLKHRGYKFIHFGDHWHPTSRNKYADVNVNYYWLSEFSMLLYETTIFSPISVRLGLLDKRREQWKRILYKFGKLAEIPQIGEPTFVFAHMLLPHSPYVFDQEGRFVTKATAQRQTEEVNYVKQLVFTNRCLKELVDTLIANSDVAPIIVFQSDEGPFPPRYREATRTFDWNQATDGELKRKMGILNAYYLPGAPSDVLYPSVSPVNSFRIILDLYFNQDIEILPDRYYGFSDYRHLYDFFDITDRLEGID